MSSRFQYITSSSSWKARIFQHECDHLNGVLFPDRMDEELQKEIKPEMDELISKFGEGGAL